MSGESKTMGIDIRQTDIIFLNKSTDDYQSKFYRNLRIFLLFFKLYNSIFYHLSENQLEIQLSLKSP